MGELVDDLDEMGKVGLGFMLVDELQQIDLGDGHEPRPTYINVGLTTEQKVAVHELLKEFTNCFAWNYTKMPGLGRDLVEHTLPIKMGFRPHKQPARSFNPKIVGRIKDIERLLEAKFIRMCRYAEWISNIVPVEKKNMGKVWICIDFCDIQPLSKGGRPKPGSL
jgi:hypothetical protein